MKHHSHLIGHRCSKKLREKRQLTYVNVLSFTQKNYKLEFVYPFGFLSYLLLRLYKLASWKKLCQEDTSIHLPF